MHHGETKGLIKVHEGAAAQPVKQLVAVGRRQHVIEGVAFFSRSSSLRRSQQMEIMIAEHAHRIVTLAFDEAQHF